MKVTIITFVTILFSLGLHAQSRKDVAVDKITKQTVDYAVVADKAKTQDAVWDFSHDELDGKDFRQTFFLWSDSTGTQALCSEKGTRTSYVLRGDTLVITGYHNSLTRMEYDEGESWLRFPMRVGDCLTGTFHGRGTYCDKLAMRTYGRYRTKAERLGTMVLPDGDTLRNVLHLKTERISAARYYPIALRDSLRPANKDSVMLWLDTDSDTTRAVIARWYVPGCRYPVLEARTLFHGTESAPYFTLALYYPPSVQAEQQRSAASHNSLERMFVAGNMADIGAVPDGNGGKGESAVDGTDGNQSIRNVVVSTSGQTVTVSYELTEDATVKAMVCNVAGMVLRQESQSGVAGTNNEMAINCVGLRHGQYVLYLNVNGQVNSMTINL